MILAALVFILLAAGLLAAIAARWSATASRMIALFAVAADLELSLWLWVRGS